MAAPGRAGTGVPPRRIAAVPPFAVTRSQDPAGQDVLVVAGDVDLATSHQLLAAVDQTVQSGADAVRLDLDAVRFLDSTGVGALLKIRRTAVAAGLSVEVVRRSRAVARVLALAGVDDLFSPQADSA